jgi:hypothetical protein
MLLCPADNSSTQASITFPTNGTTTTTAAADEPDADIAALEAAQEQALFGGMLLPTLADQCAAKYKPCTCSSACCEGLVCGFPIIRGSAFEQQAGHAFNQPTAEQLVHNAEDGVDKPKDAKASGRDSTSKITTESGGSSNRRSMKSDEKQQQQQQGSGSAVFESGSAEVAALGPSCRPLPEVDLVTGVVNYGC